MEATSEIPTDVHNLMDERATVSLDPRRMAALTRNRAVMLQMSGAEAGRLFPVEGELTTLGRGRGCNAVFDDSALSRVHARVVHRGGRVFLTDAGSTNGTYVNDARVTEALLREGDRVRLGMNITLQLQWVSPEEEQALTDLYASSTCDALTGLANRRYLDKRLASELAFATRHDKALALLLLDVDHFKRINDTHGHPAGDAVLRSLAKRVVRSVRAEDLVARYGGEEIAILVRDATCVAAAMLAERIRIEIARAPLGLGEVSIPVTVSIGVATLACGGTERTAARLLACADARLYRAKSAGRDRIMWSDAADSVAPPSCLRGG